MKLKFFLFFILAILLIILFYYFLIKPKNNTENFQSLEGQDLSCVYVFQSKYPAGELAAVQLDRKDVGKVIEKKQYLGNIEIASENTFFIYDYLCDKEFPNYNFLINLPSVDYNLSTNLDDHEIYFDSYQNFYICRSNKIGISIFDTLRLTTMINDGSIYNNCEKIK